MASPPSQHAWIQRRPERVLGVSRLRSPRARTPLGIRTCRRSSSRSPPAIAPWQRELDDMAEDEALMLRAQQKWLENGRGRERGPGRGPCHANALQSISVAPETPPVRELRLPYTVKQTGGDHGCKRGKQGYKQVDSRSFMMQYAGGTSTMLLVCAPYYTGAQRLRSTSKTRVADDDAERGRGP